VYFVHATCTGAPGTSFTSIDLGAYSANTQSYFSRPADSGQETSVSGFLRVRHGFSLGKRFTFEPSFGALLPWKSGVDGFSKLFTFHLGLDFGVPVFSFLKWRLGPGIQFLVFAQGGSEVPLNNGTGTSTFYVPGTWRVGFLGIVETGIEAALTKNISLGLDIFIVDIASSARRRVNSALTVGIVL
jgi:hypothetical protein